MHTTSPTLLERLRQPNQPEAWGRFVELYSPLLYYWARRLGLQESDAADLVQDVFTVLLEKLPEFQYDPNRTFRGWLRTVTVNKFLERRRKEAAARKHVKPGPVPELPDEDQLEAIWDEEYNRHVLGRALEVLKREFEPHTLKACWEFVVEGRKAADVAAELGIKEGAVRAAKFRVLCRLRQELDGLID